MKRKQILSEIKKEIGLRDLEYYRDRSIQLCFASYLGMLLFAFDGRSLPQIMSFAIPILISVVIYIKQTKKINKRHPRFNEIKSWENNYLIQYLELLKSSEEERTKGKFTADIVKLLIAKKHPYITKEEGVFLGEVLQYLHKNELSAQIQGSFLRSFLMKQPGGHSDIDILVPNTNEEEFRNVVIEDLSVGRYKKEEHAKSWEVELIRVNTSYVNTFVSYRFIIKKGEVVIDLSFESYS